MVMLYESLRKAQEQDSVDEIIKKSKDSYSKQAKAMAAKISQRVSPPWPRRVS